MPLRIQCMQVGAEPCSRAVGSDLADWNDFGPDPADGPSGQIDVDRPSHGAAAKSWCSGASAKKGLVDVVMQDRAEPLPILATEAARERLCNGVANRVGMTQAFALDGLNGVIDDFERG